MDDDNWQDPEIFTDYETGESYYYDWKGNKVYVEIQEEE